MYIYTYFSTKHYLHVWSSRPHEPRSLTWSSSLPTADAIAAWKYVNNKKHMDTISQNYGISTNKYNMQIHIHNMSVIFSNLPVNNFH